MAAMTSSYAKGVMGETAALQYLAARGLQPHERRYRGGRGEIDLILLGEDTLVFTEVKTRERSSTAQAGLSVTRAKQSRLSEAACYYVGEHPEYADYMMRFDVVTVTPEGIEHFENAFELVCG